ncbi:helicase domain protein [Nitzschia inconspicua]|uniref:Helicase domain protein n=1 Tax=Nitzschia inconspicua TaxID=303405 RepID=A0A9K3KET9_9STRA|nr:helicase domain protein [Nitzschia inconspicua]
MKQYRIARNNKDVQDLSGRIDEFVGQKQWVELNVLSYDLASIYVYKPLPTTRDYLNPLDLLGQAANISCDDSKPFGQQFLRQQSVIAAEVSDPKKDMMISSTTVSSREVTENSEQNTTTSRIAKSPILPPTSSTSADRAFPSREGKNAISTESVKSMSTLSASPLPLEASEYIARGTSRGKKDEKWLGMLKQLVQYKKEHGSCLVPRGYAANPRLASWIAEQRKQYKLFQDGKSSSMTPERISLLDGLGFEWMAQKAAWSRHMSDLKRFKAENGHCLVPLHCSKYPKLGLWVKEQRRHYNLLKQGRKSHMTEARVQELREIGFTFDTHESVFLQRLKELALYKEKFGDCQVPTNFEENPKLGTWCHHQRRQYKKWCLGKQCHITEYRIRALNNLGFVWNPRKNSRNQDEESHSDGSSDGSLSDSDQNLETLDLRPPKRLRSG